MHHIESFCLGHTHFVTAIALSSRREHQHLCLSGGGDGKLCLWDFARGKLMHTLDAGNGAINFIESQGNGEAAMTDKTETGKKFVPKCDAEVNWIRCCPISGVFAVSVKMSSSIQIYQIVTSDKNGSHEGLGKYIELKKTIVAKGEVLAGTFDPITGALLLLWANDREGSEEGEFTVGLQAFPLHKKTDEASIVAVTQSAVKLEGKMREVRAQKSLANA